MPDPMLPTAPPPLVQIEPAQLDKLQQKGLVSPNVAQMARVRALDARLGLSPTQGLGFSSVFGQGPGVVGGAPAAAGRGALGVPSPAAVPSPQGMPPAQAQPPQAKPSPKAKQRKLTQDEKTFIELVTKLKTSDVLNTTYSPSDSTFAYGSLPAPIKQLIERGMAPTKKGEKRQFPVGWDLKDLSPQETAMLAKMQVAALREAEARKQQSLADPAVQQQIQAAGAPLPRGP